MKVFLLLLISVLFVSPQSISPLSSNLRIESKKLGYTLQYRVYTPPGYDSLSSLPVLYVTDGQWYIESGQVHDVMDQLINDGKMEPAIAVFVDNRDPDNLSNNRRNKQFFCNRRYAAFYEEELIPHIDATYRTDSDRESRVILGLSFGGLNAACFGLQAHDSFQGIAMQSPATHPVPRLLSSYEEKEKLPLDIFLSSGTQKDNEERTRQFKRILEKKGYELKYIEVPFGHNWQNWKPLIDDVLLHYFGTP